MPNPLITKAYDKAVEVLRACAKPEGFYASGLPGGYEAVWSRDSQIASLGASLAGNEFEKPIAASLELLAKHQDELGLIPNCVGSYNLERESDVTFNSIDAPLWFIIGHFVYARAFRRPGFAAANKKRIEKALAWLAYQDPNSDGLIVQQPTGDWQDAFPHKYGRVISTQALYYAALVMAGEKKKAAYVKASVNGDGKKYLKMFDEKLGYYRPWAWKDHDGDKETEDWFDSFGNVMAIAGGLATPAIAKKILSHIEKKKINKPFPLKAIWPPLEPGGREWRSYFEKCNAREPYAYLNGGVWPFIGGFYVAALIRTGMQEKAEKELAKMAEGLLKKIKEPDSPQYMEMKKDDLKKLGIKDSEELRAYRQKEFNEWLDGRTGEPKGEPYQAWSAGMYIYAYECVRNKQVLFFS